MSVASNITFATANTSLIITKPIKTPDGFLPSGVGFYITTTGLKIFKKRLFKGFMG